jgi:hypothetical protein
VYNSPGVREVVRSLIQVFLEPIVTNKTPLALRVPRWVKPVATAFAIVLGLFALLMTPGITLWIGLRRYRLRREIRRAWGDGVRIIVRDDHREPGLWSRVLQERWPTELKSRTLTLGALPSNERDRRDHRYPLEWRVYLEWGPDYKFTPPPVAVVVRSDGVVHRVAFQSALQALAAGDPSCLDEQFAELNRLIG